MGRFKQLNKNCDSVTCLKTCKDVVNQINQDPCFKGENRRTLKRETFWMYPQQRTFAQQFWGLLESCDREIQTENYQSYVIDTDVDETVVEETVMEKNTATYLSGNPTVWLSVLCILTHACQFF